MKRVTILALVTCALGAGIYAGTVMATAPSGVATTLIGKALFDEFRTDAHTIPADRWQAQLRTRGASDLYVVDNKFSPGGSTGWHSHPGPSLILVISGTVTNYSSDAPSCAGQDYSAGRGFIDPAGAVHQVRNNTTAPAEVVAVQLLPQDSLRRTDEAQPSNCNP